MSQHITIEPISPGAFAPFGDVIDCSGEPEKIINQGKCARFHDRAELDFSDGKAGISLFKSELRTLPYQMELMERHPEGSQAFVPMSHDPFLVIVAKDAQGPKNIRAFETTAGQVINIHRNVWHGVLTPLSGTGVFAVIDRIGAGTNLEEHYFKSPVVISKGV